ncbi:hypothetical protein, partial [Escherichia coli]|uniref:hypothetical protein n=1 Tax=Escherichia coli TaxID=562 RepID=UPI00200DD139
DHAPLTMLDGVIQGKCERGQRLPATRGHREREQAWLQVGSVTNMPKNLGPYLIDRTFGPKTCQMLIQTGPQLPQPRSIARLMPQRRAAFDTVV